MGVDPVSHGFIMQRVNTGVSRKVDDLGRIVLPAELRRSFGLKEGAELEISVEEDRIILTPRRNACVFCGTQTDLKEFQGRMICTRCVGELSGSAQQPDPQWDPFAQA